MSSSVHTRTAVVALASLLSATSAPAASLITYAIIPQVLLFEQDGLPPVVADLQGQPPFEVEIQLPVSGTTDSGLRFENLEQVSGNLAFEQGTLSMNVAVTVAAGEFAGDVSFAGSAPIRGEYRFDRFEGLGLPTFDLSQFFGEAASPLNVSIAGDVRMATLTQFGLVAEYQRYAFNVLDGVCELPGSCALDPIAALIPTFPPNAGLPLGTFAEFGFALGAGAPSMTSGIAATTDSLTGLRLIGRIVTVSAVPLPPAALLLSSVLAVCAGFRRESTG